MNKLKTLCLSSALVVGTALAGQASALTIDFTDSNVWGSSPGNNVNYFASEKTATYTGPLEVSVTASPAGSQITWEQQDGFGVFGENDSEPWNDDIENGIESGSGSALTEILNVSFSQSTLVGSVRISDLYGSGEYNTGSGWTSFGFGSGINGPGSWYVIDTTASTGIMFRAIGNSSFQVSGMNVLTGNDIVGQPSAVPLPPAVWLLGSAMVFLVRKRRVS